MAEQEAASEQEPASEPVKTFTQEDVNRLVGEARVKARPADYDDLKAKAAKLDEIEQANKSEVEKLREKLDAAQAARDAQARDMERLQVLASSGIPAEYQDLVQGASADELTASAEKVRKLLEERKQPAYAAPAEGKAPVALNGDPLLNMLNKALNH